MCRWMLWEVAVDISGGRKDWGGGGGGHKDLSEQTVTALKTRQLALKCFQGDQEKKTMPFSEKEDLSKIRPSLQANVKACTMCMQACVHVHVCVCACACLCLRMCMFVSAHVLHSVPVCACTLCA